MCLCVVLRTWNALVCFCSTSFFVFWLGTKTRGMMRCAFSRVFLGGIKFDMICMELCFTHALIIFLPSCEGKDGELV